MELDRPAHAQVGLNVRPAAELVESGLHAVDHHAITDRRGQGDGPRGLRLREERNIESCRGVNGSRQNEALPDVFAGGTIISRGEGVEGITDAIHIIEELSNLASPGFCASERVVRDKIQAVGYVALKMQRKSFVAGTIVGAEHGDVWKIVAPVAVHAGLESVVRAQNPVGVEGVLNASRSM